MTGLVRGPIVIAVGGGIIAASGHAADAESAIAFLVFGLLIVLGGGVWAITGLVRAINAGTELAIILEALGRRAQFEAAQARRAAHGAERAD